MTLQQHFNLIKEGKGNKAQFLKHARSLFPEYFNQYTDFDTATNVLKTKQVISEAAGGVVTKGFSVYDWKKILGEEVKAVEKETSKEVLDYRKNAYNNSDMKNADNINFNEIMKGFYAELKDEKNAGKTGDEIKDMVVKNLGKDPLFYTKDGMFGEKGVGYVTEAPGLGEPKEPKGKFKASGYGDLKEGKIPAENRNTYYYVSLAKDMKKDGKSKEEIKQFFKDEKVNDELVDNILANLFMKVKENKDINWDNLSAEDASKLFDYHERTGMLPTDLSAEKYDEIMKKYGISRQDDSDIPFKNMTEEQKLRSVIRNLIKEELEDDKTYFVVKNASSNKYEVKKASKFANKTKTGSLRFKTEAEAKAKADKLNK
jgi:hypothetical protein